MGKFQLALALVKMAVHRYGQINSAGSHCPVLTVLSQAVKLGLYGVGEAQIESMLRGPVIFNLLRSDEEDDVLRAALAGFKVLREYTGQTLATWSVDEGAWVMTDPAMLGTVECLGAYRLHDPKGAYGPRTVVPGA